MALVLHDTAASTAAGERLSVSGSTSTSTGRAPTCSITLTEAVNVSGVVITSSPGPTPSVASAVCRPAVQELSASALGAPRCSAKSASKRFVLGPVVIQSERSVSTTSRISSSPKSGGEKGRNWLRRAGAGVAGIAAGLTRGRASGSDPRGPAPGAPRGGGLWGGGVCAAAPGGRGRGGGGGGGGGGVAREAAACCAGSDGTEASGC